MSQSLRQANSRGVLVYDNLFDNRGTNAEESFSDATWSLTPRAGTNVLGGPVVAGNAWNDDLCFDRVGDGVCDDLYLPLKPRPRELSFGAGAPPTFDLFPLVYSG